MLFVSETTLSHKFSTGGSCDGGASLRFELIQRLETLFWGVHPILKLVIHGRIEKRIVNVGNQCWPFSLVGVEAERTEPFVVSTNSPPEMRHFELGPFMKSAEVSLCTLRGLL